MATPVVYQTLNNVGIDPTVFYAVQVSTTPETPAPPFYGGTRAFGSDGSEFVFVQASTSISLGDFVMLTASGAMPSTTSGYVSFYQANSLTTTNVASSLAVGVGSAGLVLKQSVSFIPAQAYFWACTKGQYVPAFTSNGLASNTSGVYLFTSATAGTLTSATGAGPCLVGIVCVNSLTTAISGSVVPAGLGQAAAGGLTIGPIVNLNSVRSGQTIISSAAGTVTTTPVLTF